MPSFQNKKLEGRGKNSLSTSGARTKLHFILFLKETAVSKLEIHFSLFHKNCSIQISRKKKLGEF